MTLQLALFSGPSTPGPIIDPIAGFVPEYVRPNDPFYRPFNGAEVRRIVLQLCEASGPEWVRSNTIYKKLRMHPCDISKMLHRMHYTGELERAPVYFGSSSPALGNYKGFDYGFRLPQKPLEQEATA